MERGTNITAWSVDLGITRPKDFLHVCTEPDNILRMTSNMPSHETLAVLRRALTDLEVLIALRGES